MHLCIMRFISTFNTLLQYETFCTQYNTYHVLYDIDNYATKY